MLIMHVLYKAKPLILLYSKYIQGITTVVRWAQSSFLTDRYNLATVSRMNMLHTYVELIYFTTYSLNSCYLIVNV